ncbi:MAG: hypothetical protein ACPGLV_11910, partial [Bacteroidia bacterium]
KMDEFSEESFDKTLFDLKRGYLSSTANRVLFISAAKRINLSELRNTLLEEVKKAYKKIYPHKPNPYNYY